jgi:hypothetical protein
MNAGPTRARRQNEQAGYVPAGVNYYGQKDRSRRAKRELKPQEVQDAFRGNKGRRESVAPIRMTRSWITRTPRATQEHAVRSDAMPSPFEQSVGNGTIPVLFPGLSINKVQRRRHFPAQNRPG